jgi:uridine kinase
MIIEKQEDLILELSHRLLESEGMIIGVDGYFGVGKSGLARSIAGYLGGKWIELDDYVNKGTGQYVPSLQIERLRGEIDAFMEENPILVVEGVCLLATLEKVGAVPDLLVYIKRVDSDGIWYYADELICDISRPLQEALSMIERLERRAGQGNPDREVARYHRSFAPLEKADFVVVWRH